MRYKRQLSGEFMKKILSVVGEKTLGIFTTVQFLSQLEQLKLFMEEHGRIPLVGDSNYRALESGQVLGCDITGPKSVEKESEAFVYLGSGMFHPIALALKTEKRIYIANPLTEEVSLMDAGYRTNYLKRLDDMKKKFSMAKKIGILVSIKPGQMQLDLAKKAETKLKEKGRKVYLFYFDTLVPEELLNFSDIDAWVNTACPRIAIDDMERFEKPVLNVLEVI